MSYPTEIVICDVCGKEYERLKKSSNAKIGKVRKACSPTCKNQLSHWSGIKERFVDLS